MSSNEGSVGAPRAIENARGNASPSMSAHSAHHWNWTVHRLPPAIDEPAMMYQPQRNGGAPGAHPPPAWRTFTSRPVASSNAYTLCSSRG